MYVLHHSFILIPGCFHCTSVVFLNAKQKESICTPDVAIPRCLHRTIIICSVLCLTFFPIMPIALLNFWLHLHTKMIALGRHSKWFPGAFFVRKLLFRALYLIKIIWILSQNILQSNHLPVVCLSIYICSTSILSP